METPNQDPRLISFSALRKSIGWLGILLPAAMLTGNYLFGHCTIVQESVSQYYYSITVNMLVGILCSVALFLLSYKGYPGNPFDNILTSLAGLFALGIAFFATNECSTNSCAIVHLPINDARSTTHYVCAAGFFILLAIISLFLFTKSKGSKTPEKKIRNGIYKICGIAILFFITLLVVYSKWERAFSSLSSYKPVFWLEWGALISFGISWLVKGELFLKDKPADESQIH